jgi:hypothetical protein
MIYFHLLIKPCSEHIDAGLCKGSTTDSGSVCLGSNPSPAATMHAAVDMISRIGGCFL